jgi:hypothetical protein
MFFFLSTPSNVYYFTNKRPRYPIQYQVGHTTVDRALRSDTPRYHAKMNHVLYVYLHRSLFNGILLHTSSSMYGSKGRSNGSSRTQIRHHRGSNEKKGKNWMLQNRYYQRSRPILPLELGAGTTTSLLASCRTTPPSSWYPNIRGPILGR